jgi:DNA (cytosine-5)-methyltransferase 1
MLLLDLYCGSGGAGRGYQLAGFDVVGVDIAPQPDYPGIAVVGDAIEYARQHGHRFDAVHASPPCQRYSHALHGKPRWHHPDLVGPTREVLLALGLPYVIENVPGAPLLDPVVLCGEMFGLAVIRHRLFEVNWPLAQPPHPPHRGTVRDGAYLSVAGHGGDSVTRSLSAVKWAMEMPWATTYDGVVQAVPPAYTEHIGLRLRGFICDNCGAHLRVPDEDREGCAAVR